LVSKKGYSSWILLKLRAFPQESVWKKETTKSPDYLSGEETEKIIPKEKYKTINPQATGIPYLTFNN